MLRFREKRESGMGEEYESDGSIAAFTTPKV